MTNPNSIDEQLSAFADGELPRAEAGLLLARLAREPALRARWERYHAIGEALRDGLPARYPRSLAARVAAALEPEPTHAGARRARYGRHAMPLVGMAVAASVAVMGVLVVRTQTEAPASPVAPLSASAERETKGGGMVVDYSPQMRAKLGAYVVRHGELAGRALPAVAPHVRVAAREAEEVPAAATPPSTANDAAPKAGGSPP
jgi:sigma-E factor negative regulatory protein RseA